LNETGWDKDHARDLNVCIGKQGMKEREGDGNRMEVCHKEFGGRAMAMPVQNSAVHDGYWAGEYR